MRGTIIAAIIAITVPQFAAAEGFSIEDLGDIANDAQCLDRAQQVYNAYKSEVRAGDIAVGSWTAALYDIRNDEYDAVITCNFGPNEGVRATLVVFSTVSDSSVRRGIAARIKQIWQRY